MKCRLTNKKDMTALLLAGLVLLAIGSAADYLLPDAARLATTLAGFASGVGSSMMVIGGVALLRLMRLGEQRAKDVELTMTDERGLAVAYKAQSAMAIVAVFSMIAVSLAALVRGDEFYMMLVSMLLCAVALAKLAAWWYYNKRM